MKTRAFVFRMIGVLLVCAAGCAGKTPGPAGPETGVVLINAEKPAETMDGESPANEMPASAKPAAISTEKLRGVQMNLEAFRLFCAHFKIQGDRRTLNAVRPAVREYIEQYVDPILNRTHRLRNDDVSRMIVIVYYRKAYLHWLLGDDRKARAMVAQIRRNIPEQLKKESVRHADQGDITIDAALRELERHIAADLQAAGLTDSS